MSTEFQTHVSDFLLCTNSQSSHTLPKLRTSPGKPPIAPRSEPGPPRAPPVPFVVMPLSCSHGPKTLVPCASLSLSPATPSLSASPVSPSSKTSPKSDRIISLLIALQWFPILLRKKTPQSFPWLPRPCVTSPALRQLSDFISCLFPSCLLAFSLRLASRELDPPQDLGTCWSF